MLFTFMQGLSDDEKYIAEFIFICLSSNQKARMINEDAGTGVHQDLCSLSEASSALEHKISFGFALPMCTCSFGDVLIMLNHTW